MAQLNFFAAEADLKAIVDFLVSSTDVRIFESYSEPGEEIREFPSAAELMAAFQLGIDKHGNGTAVLLQLWSPSVMADLTISRIQLDPSACKGHTFRHRIDGGGLIQLYLGGVSGRAVTHSHFGHQSQARAKAWETDHGVNWQSLKKVSNRIQYAIRKLAVAKVPGCPVLPQACELARAGYALKRATQSPGEYELQPLPERLKRSSG